MDSYNNDSIKNKITQIIKTELHEMFINYFNFIDNFLLFISEEIDFLSKIKEHNKDNILFQQSNFTYNYGPDRINHLKKILKFNNFCNNLINKFLVVGMHLMDFYKLRRILDKDYVSNTISYAGAGHSNNYIRLLVKYFDFKITNYSYIKNDDMVYVKKYINSSKTSEDLFVLFHPYVFGQCSDISSFPKLFT